jgi:hypothetical protein
MSKMCIELNRCAVMICEPADSLRHSSVAAPDWVARGSSEILDVVIPNDQSNFQGAFA